MGIEIERRFLVKTRNLPPLRNGVEIAQGYLARNPAVRVRVTKKKSWLTIKGPGDIQRAEFEYEIPRKEGVALLTMCKTSLTKTRYTLRFGKHYWDVDCFDGPHLGLWLAEIELKSKDEKFPFPGWLGAEVTHDGRYTNAALAKAGCLPE
jgi:adenylate cyclase